MYMYVYIYIHVDCKCITYIDLRYTVAVTVITVLSLFDVFVQVPSLLRDYWPHPLLLCR